MDELGGVGVLGFPVADPLETSATPAARKILAAARRLLAEQGYDAITYVNVARAAGVNPGSIRYNFGNKAGLMAAVVDALMHDEFARMSTDRPLASDERLTAAIRAMERMVLSAEEFRGFLDILPHAIRDDDLREQIAVLYPGGLNST